MFHLSTEIIIELIAIKFVLYLWSNENFFLSLVRIYDIWFNIAIHDDHPKIVMFHQSLLLTSGIVLHSMSLGSIRKWYLEYVSHVIRLQTMNGQKLRRSKVINCMLGALCHIKREESPRGRVANVLDYIIVVSEFELQSRY